MAHLIETERLTLRLFEPADDTFIFKLLNSPGWLRFIGNRNIRTTDDARNYITGIFLPGYARFGFRPYLVQLKAGDEPIGMCSLVKRDALEDVDIGYCFLDEFMGRGYAYEATLATLNYAVKDLGIARIVAITDTDNAPSVKLLKKLGMRLEKTVLLPGEEEEIFLFSNQAPGKGR